MKKFGDRIDAAVSAWKAKLGGGQRSREPGSAPRSEDAVAELQNAANQLELELAELLDTAALEMRRAADFEALAMKAIRAGDDGVAREALLMQRNRADTLASLEADATVLRGMIAECRAVLGQASKSGPGPMPPPA